MKFEDELIDLLAIERDKLADVRNQAGRLLNRCEKVESRIKALEDTAEMYKRSQAGQPLSEAVAVAQEEGDESQQVADAALEAHDKYKQRCIEALRERDAAIERGKGLCDLYQQMHVVALDAVDVAQRAIEKGEAAERDAQAQRAEERHCGPIVPGETMVLEDGTRATAQHCEACNRSWFPAEALGGQEEGEITPRQMAADLDVPLEILGETTDV